jgi:hypothetical protein
VLLGGVSVEVLEPVGAVDGVDADPPTELAELLGLPYAPWLGELAPVAPLEPKLLVELPEPKLLVLL